MKKVHSLVRTEPHSGFNYYATGIIGGLLVGLAIGLITANSLTFSVVVSAYGFALICGMWGGMIGGTIEKMKAARATPSDH